MEKEQMEGARVEMRGREGDVAGRRGGTSQVDARVKNM